MMMGGVELVFMLITLILNRAKSFFLSITMMIF